MNCFRPLRIHNRYSDDWLYVPCRECDACRINSANQKVIQLSNDIKKYKKSWFVTLDYDNFSVPFILKGMNSIMRYGVYDRKQASVEWKHLDFPLIIDTFDDDISKVKVKYLRNHSVKDAVGILYYKDIQNFFKRFRKNINKDYGKTTIRFKQFTCGEYGSKSGRPHFHIIFYSNDERLTSEVLKTAIIESWPLCDWNRCKLYKDNEEWFKRCDNNTSSYVASYVNGSLCCCGISQIKRFRQKTIRSKDVSFGINDEIKDKVRAFVNQRNVGAINYNNPKIFEYIDKSRIDRLSSSPIPSRYIYTLFPKYKGYSGASFSTFQKRARNIFTLFYSSYRRSLVDKEILSSLDCAFMRGFERWKSLLDISLSKEDYHLPISLSDRQLFEDYLIQHDIAHKLYNAICLKYEMLQYESLGKDYFLTKINTYAYDLRKRQRKISAYRHEVTSSIDINKPPHIMRALHKKCNQYYYRLLPKHFNDLIKL